MLATATAEASLRQLRERHEALVDEIRCLERDCEIARRRIRQLQREQARNTRLAQMTADDLCRAVRRRSWAGPAETRLQRDEDRIRSAAERAGVTGWEEIEPHLQ